jgi:hypothetical protein
MIGFTSTLASAQPGQRAERTPLGFVGTMERTEMVVTSESPATEDSPTRTIMWSAGWFNRA